MKYRGVIIEESLDDKSCLEDLKIVSTKVERVTKSHQTPWLKQWTLHTVEIDESKAESLASRLCHALDKEHEWYADFKNQQYHFIIFRGKVFKVDRSVPSAYEKVKAYGKELGIPEYQLDFSPNIK